MKSKLLIFTIFVFATILTTTHIVSAQEKCGDEKEGLRICTTRRTISVPSGNDVRVRVSIRNNSKETKMLEIYRPEQHYDVQVYNPDGSRLPTTIENKYKGSSIIPRELAASLPLSHGMGEVPIEPSKTIKTELNLSNKYTFVKGTYRVEISRRIRTRSLGRATLTVGPIFVRVT